MSSQCNRTLGSHGGVQPAESRLESRMEDLSLHNLTNFYIK